MPVQVGDLVHITSDGSKAHARNRYVVVSVDGLWCHVCKFTGSQLRSTFYRVERSECYRFPDLTETTSNLPQRYSSDSYPEDINEEPLTSGFVDEEPAHVPKPQSTPNPTPALVSSELATPPDPQSVITPVPEASPLPGGSGVSESSFSLGSRRSSRLTRRPAYLKDYVT